MEWILAGLIGASIAWVNYLGFRVRKLEGESKTQAEQVAWLHKRCEKLEAFSIESFVGGAHPQWQYDALRKWLIDHRTPSDPADMSAER